MKTSQGTIGGRAAGFMEEMQQSLFSTVQSAWRRQGLETHP